MSSADLHNTPLANRRHIVLLGATNTGKSTLFNALLDQDLSIVSKHHGTTTDPVIKTMELIGYGPIALIDTAGLNDNSELGQARIERSRRQLVRSDAALYLADASKWVSSTSNHEHIAYRNLCSELDRYKIPHLLIFSKADLLSSGQQNQLKRKYPDAIAVSLLEKASVQQLYSKLVVLLRLADEQKYALDDPKPITITNLKMKHVADSVIARLTDPGQTVLLIVPIDSEAPEGRLILPQVQLIRECLDQGIRCLICRESELAETLADYRDGGIDLVVTDSQAFGLAASLVPEAIPLMSFSMLLAYKKSDFKQLLDGLTVIDLLSDNDHVLICEACTHNSSHEDIGRVKIPTVLKKCTGANLKFSHCAGHSFPDNLAGYRLIVHCGGCMITDRTMRNRTCSAREQGTAITNYGLLLAYGNGILNRSIDIFRRRGLL